MTGRGSKTCERFAVLLRRLFQSQDNNLVKCLHMWGDEKKRVELRKTPLGAAWKQYVGVPPIKWGRRLGRLWDNLPWASCISYKEAIKTTNSLCLVLHRRTRHGPHPFLIYSIFIYFIHIFASFIEWHQEFQHRYLKKVQKEEKSTFHSWNRLNENFVHFSSSAAGGGRDTKLN